MIALAIQVLLNVIIFRVINQDHIKTYKRFSYVIYLVVLLVWVGRNSGITIRPWALFADITFLTRPTTYGLVLVSVVVQMLFNTQYQKMVKPQGKK